MRPTPRSGGHSFQGFSTSTGLIIDIYAKLFQQGKMPIPGGTWPLVGISGLTQGGGGGGNFGVVTAFDFVPVPVDMAGCTAGQRAYGSRPITSNRAASAQPTARVSLWYRDSRTRADQAIKEFISTVGATPTSQTEVKQTFFEAEYDEYCAGSRMPTSSTRSLTPH